jgi:uncharacterized metal-binding protein YceD (DUF177 family)
MKVRLSDISPDGMTIDDTIPLEPLNSRMTEGAANDIYFLVAPRVQLTVFGSERGAETKGTVKTRYRQPCARCMKEIEMDLEVETNFILKPKPERAAQGKYQSDATMDDVGIVYFEGEHIDLEDIIQETLILALSPFLLPPVDQAGACTICRLTGVH